MRLSCRVTSQAMAIATNLPESWLRDGTALYQRHGRTLPVIVAALFAILVGRAAADFIARRSAVGNLAIPALPVPAPIY